MIRKYREGDVKNVLDAWEAASRLAHPFVSEDFLESERHNIPNVYLPNTETWVWETEGRVVGFIAMIGGEIGGLFLQPEFHSQGIGRALVDHVRELKGDLEVDVFEANTIGRTFYDKYGLVQIPGETTERDGHRIIKMQIAAKSL